MQIIFAVTEAPPPSLLLYHHIIMSKEVHIPRRMTSLSVIGAGLKKHRQHNILQSYFSGVLDVRGEG